MDNIYFNEKLYIYSIDSPIDFGWEFTIALKDLDSNVIILTINFLENCKYNNGEIQQIAVLTLPSNDGEFKYGLVLKFENNGNTFVASPYKLDYLLNGGEYLGCTVSDETQIVTSSPPVYSINKQDQFIEWNGLYCRSTPENVIAQELENRKIPFLLNAGGRFNLKNKRVTREPDFLVFVGNGKSAILEVDGEQYHQNPAKDRERDLMFRTLGIKVERFTAKQCMEEPSEVVSEFLKLVQN
jgi:hypothetical protein